MVPLFLVLGLTLSPWDGGTASKALSNWLHSVSCLLAKALVKSFLCKGRLFPFCLGNASFQI